MQDPDLASPARALHGELTDLIALTWRRALRAEARPAPPTHAAHRTAGLLAGLGAALVGLALTVSDPAAGVPVPAATDAVAQARLAFRQQQYAQAYGRFAALADAGDAPSALMALAMLRHGPALFGSDWSASAGQWHRWSALAFGDAQVPPPAAAYEPGE